MRLIKRKIDDNQIVVGNNTVLKSRVGLELEWSLVFTKNAEVLTTFEMLVC